MARGQYNIVDLILLNELDKVVRCKGLVGYNPCAAKYCAKEKECQTAIPIQTAGRKYD